MKSLDHKLFPKLTSAFFLNLCLLSSIYSISSHNQQNNSVSGFIFNTSRKPVADIVVELYDEFSRTLGRTRTNSSGRYLFSRLSSGRFRIKVLPLGTNFEEQEYDFEIQNFYRDTNAGLVATGFENVQRDFYLKVRKDQSSSALDTIFAQDIPQKAFEAYKQGCEMLDNGNLDGLKKIRESIEIFPDYFEAIEKLGLEYIKTKNYVPSHILLLRSSQINPRSYRSWYGLGYSLYSLNINNEAIKAIQKSLSIDKESSEANLLMGVLLKRTGNFEEALKYMLLAKKYAKKTTPEVHWQLALLLGNNMKRYRDAADELELFLEIQNNVKDVAEIRKLIKDFREKSIGKN